MKIAIIGLRGVPALSGGVEHVIEKLAPLIAKKAEITVYCRKHYVKEARKSWQGVKLRSLPCIDSKHLETISHTTLATIDASFRNFDIIHYQAMGNGLFSIFPRLLFKKTIVTLHGLDYEREKWGMAAKLFLKLSERALTVFPNRIVSCSKKIRNYLLDKYGAEAEFIPNGVDMPAAVALDAMKSLKLEKGKYVLFLSRIVPEKGLHFLIDAFKEIDTDMKLVIVGDTTHTKDYLKKCIKMADKDKRILFAGPKYGKEKAELFSNAYCFVLPSTIEGMPIVLLEAMSYGLPCLVSDIQENMDVIEDTGYSFKTKDHADLKRKLDYMLTHKVSGAKGKALVEKEYKWEEIAKSYLRLYEEVLG